MISNNTHLIFWSTFVLLYIIVFSIDMRASSHSKEEMTVKKALRWTGLWVSIALLYGVSIFLFYPTGDSTSLITYNYNLFGLFISGYFIEYSLSVDNLFVFIMIFSLMGVSNMNQPKLLKLGVLMSIILRIAFIFAGVGLVQRFSWIMYVLGVILLWTAAKMLLTNEEDSVDPKGNILYRWAEKFFPIDPDPHTPTFFNRINGKLHLTTMFLVFLVIGSTNIVFSLDSIPAIIGVVNGSKILPAEQNFIAITSSVFAVMGLVSLFFALKGIMGLFRFLKHGVSFILVFVGVKMCMGWYQPFEEFMSKHTWLSLVVILGTLLLSILLSIAIKEQTEIEEINEEIGHLKEEIKQLKQDKEPN